jgi:hypothetical protein
MIETSCKETRCICLKAKIVAELNTVSFKIEKLGSMIFISQLSNIGVNLKIIPAIGR